MGTRRSEGASSTPTRGLVVVATFRGGTLNSNPGAAGLGGTWKRSDGALPSEFSVPVGWRSLVEADFMALAFVLRRVVQWRAHAVILITDRQIISHYFAGRYRVRSPRLVPHAWEVRNLLLRQGARYEVRLISPRKNERAAYLARLAARRSAASLRGKK